MNTVGAHLFIFAIAIISIISVHLMVIWGKDKGCQSNEK